MSTPEITDVPVRDGGIRLGQFLKFVGVAGSGAEAGGLVTDGEVLVDGVVETRRGRQLERGAVVEVRRPAGSERFRVT
jgi:ribosome-associated protein